MSKHLAELCTLLVDGTYGELASRIFSTLLIHGRLTTIPLSQRSDLPLRHVRHGLAVLIQQRLVYYSISDDDGLAYYEVDVRNAYDTIRSGKIVQHIQDRAGTDAAGLASLIQHFGYAGASEVLSIKIPALTPVVDSAAIVNGKAPTNGVVNGRPNEAANGTLSRERTGACERLFASKYVIQVLHEDFLSATDFHALVERAVEAEDFGGEVKGTKKLAEFRQAVSKRKTQFLDARTATLKLLDRNQHEENNKRGASALFDGEQAEGGQSQSLSTSHPKKKRKTDSANGYEAINSEMTLAPSDDVKDEVHFHEPAVRLNRDKIDVSFRSQRLVDLSARFLGDTTSKVYNALLRQLERNIPRCHDEYLELEGKLADDIEEGDDVGYDSDDERGVTITTMEVERSLDLSIDVQSTFVEKPPNLKNPPTKGGSKEHTIEHGSAANGIAKDHPENEFVNRQKRVGLVEQHLRLLAESSHKFITRVSPQGQGTWRVDFQVLMRSLIQLELETILTARFGPIAIRIVRILYDKGKLDEKQLGQIGLIRQKDLRRVLTAMQEAGYVDTQEVPRDNTRQPSRTIYLWFYDQARCRKLILNDTYKAMSRLLQRAKVEREKVQGVIDKAERTDVKGQEEKYLSKAEQDALADWHDKEEKLLVQLSRQDDLVALLRDFLPLHS